VIINHWLNNINCTGVLVVLDARPDGILYRDLIPDYVKFARTIYEGSGFCFFSALLLCESWNFLRKVDFFLSVLSLSTLPVDDLGHVAVDVNYLNVGSGTGNYQIFICWCCFDVLHMFHGCLKCEWRKKTMNSVKDRRRENQSILL